MTDASHPATPFYYGWVIVAFSAAMQIFSIGLLFYANGVALLPWMGTFGVGRAALSAVPFACTIAISILSPFAGPVFDRYPARLLVTCSLVSLAVGLFGVSLAQSVFQLIAVHATLLTIGATGAGAFAAQTLSAKWFARRRGLALALAASGAGLGGLIMPYIMAITIEAYGWRATYAGIAVFVLVVLVPIAFMLIRNPPAVLAPIERVEYAAQQPAAGPGDAPARLTTMMILRNPVFLVTTLGMGSLVAVQVILQFYLPAMGSELGSTPAQAALLTSILAGGALISKPFWGYVIDRSDPRYSFLGLALVYAWTLIVLGTWLGPITYRNLVFVAAICGFASGAMQPLLGVVLARTFGRENFGRVLGLGYLFMNVSSFAPVLSAVIYERTGSYSLTSAILMVLLVLMLALFMRMVTNRRVTGAASAPA